MTDTRCHMLAMYVVLEMPWVWYAIFLTLTKDNRVLISFELCQQHGTKQK